MDQSGLDSPKPIFEITPNTALINEWADETYGEAAETVGVKAAEIYHSRNCEAVSHLLRKKLHERGIDSKIARYNGWDVVNHDFLLVHNDEWVIDPTWQQFLVEPTNEMPKVLICRRSRLKNELTSLGMPANKHQIWQSAEAIEI